MSSSGGICFDVLRLLSVEFNVANVSPIVWNDEAFKNLVLPAGRKTLLQSLVEAHNADVEFDDFVQGKGHGLVINLFGPPGVGKTLSAEATSEHVRSPLYVVGGGDIGTNAAELDTTLQRTFDIATSWKAIILIDEVSVSGADWGADQKILMNLIHRLTSSWSNVRCMIWRGTRWSLFCKLLLLCWLSMAC